MQQKIDLIEGLGELISDLDIVISDTEDKWNRSILNLVKTKLDELGTELIEVETDYAIKLHNLENKHLEAVGKINELEEQLAKRQWWLSDDD